MRLYKIFYLFIIYILRILFIYLSDIYMYFFLFWIILNTKIRVAICFAYFLVCNLNNLFLCYLLNKTRIILNKLQCTSLQIWSKYLKEIDERFQDDRTRPLIVNDHFHNIKYCEVVVKEVSCVYLAVFTSHA